MIPYISEMSASKINKTRKGKNCSCLDAGMSKKLQVKVPVRQVPGSRNGEGDWLWEKRGHTARTSYSKEKVILSALERAVDRLGERIKFPGI